MVILSWCLLSVLCLCVTSRYRFKPRCDKDFEFSYDGLEFLVFRHKISCHWMKGVLTNEGRKRGTPLKKVLFYCYELV